MYERERGCKFARSAWIVTFAEPVEDLLSNRFRLYSLLMLNYAPGVT
jgi:hypothetical protein